MEGLIEMIIKNPIVILAVLGGLASLMKRKKDQEKQANEESPQAQKPVVRSPQTSGQQLTKQVFKRPNPSVSVNTSSIDEHRAEQLRRYTEQMASNNSNTTVTKNTEHSGLQDRPKVADARRDVEIENLGSSVQQKQFKKQIKKGLTTEGLVNSILMAEVLGPPRARNPYQSVISKRRKGM